MDSSCEPMDIDRSSSSVTSKMDVSSTSIDDIDVDQDFGRKCKHEVLPIKVEKDYSESLGAIECKEETTPTPNLPNSLNAGGEEKPAARYKKSGINVYHIKKPSGQDMPEVSTLTRLFWGSVLAGIAMLAYPIIHFKCAGNVDVSQLKNSFSVNLIGQSEAANRITEVLNLQEKTKIIFLYGGTGVGKTYAVSLMLDDLWTSANVYFYTKSSFKESFTTDLMIGLSICQTTVVVVDDLTLNDMDLTPQLQKLIDKSEKMGKNITIILNYNCDSITGNFVKRCDNFFHHDLEENFKNIKAVKEYIKFEPLTQEHLVQCIKKELGDREVTRADINNFLKNFDVALDGCKGVSRKIRLMNIDDL